MNQGLKALPKLVCNQCKPLDRFSSFLLYKPIVAQDRLMLREKHNNLYVLQCLVYIGESTKNVVFNHLALFKRLSARHRLLVSFIIYIYDLKIPGNKCKKPSVSWVDPLAASFSKCLLSWMNFSMTLDLFDRHADRSNQFATLALLRLFSITSFWTTIKN